MPAILIDAAMALHLANRGDSGPKSVPYSSQLCSGVVAILARLRG
jgi:hypothetical protein